MSEPRRTALARVSTRALVVTGLLVALVIAGFVSFYASDDPDGLAYVAGQQGFDDTATEHLSSDSPLAAYATRGVEDDRASGAVAGITGTVVVLVLAGGTAVLLRRRRAEQTG